MLKDGSAVQKKLRGASAFLYWKWACYAIIHATLIDELEIMLSGMAL